MDKTERKITKIAREAEKLVLLSLLDRLYLASKTESRAGFPHFPHA